MNTKEAIEILKKVIICDQDDYAMVELDTLEASDIIELLKRKDKCYDCGYKKIIVSLKKLWGDPIK